MLVTFEGKLRYATDKQLCNEIPKVSALYGGVLKQRHVTPYFTDYKAYGNSNGSNSFNA